MGPQVCTPGPSSLQEDGALSLPLVREVGGAALSDAKLEAERPWGPERTAWAACRPALAQGLGPCACPRGATCRQLGVRGDERRGQAWLCPPRSGYATDLCPLIPDRVHGVCRARLARQESLGEG